MRRSEAGPPFGRHSTHPVQRAPDGDNGHEWLDHVLLQVQRSDHEYRRATARSLHLAHALHIPHAAGTPGQAAPHLLRHELASPGQHSQATVRVLPRKMGQS